MHKLTASTLFALCAISSQKLAAQPIINSYQWFDGTNLSLGTSANKSTTAAAGIQESGSSNVSVIKVNYTFSSDSRFKLGVSASADTQKSTITSGVIMNRAVPTELTLEPGYLLSASTLSYLKLGSYAASYDSPFGSQNINGHSYGAGIKSFITKRFFIQAEWTQHKATGSTSLGWDTFKQTSTAVLLGYNLNN